MKITDLLSEKAINLHGKANSKEEAIIQLVDLMVENENINDKEAYKQAVLKREEEGTTGIGEGIAKEQQELVKELLFLTEKQMQWKNLV